MNEKKYWMQEPERWANIRSSILNPVRFFLSKRDLKVKAMLSTFSWNSVCDLGCGKSEYLFEYLNKAKKIYGLDYSENMLRLAKKKDVNNVHLICADAQKIPLKDASADLVLAIGLADYLDDNELFLSECSRISKKHMIITFPNKYSPFFFLRNKNLLRFRNKFLSLPKIKNTYTKKEILNLLKKNNFIPLRTENIWRTMWIVDCMKNDK